MCGIVGLFSSGIIGEREERGLQGAVASLVHRGPDAGGVWLDPAAGVALGHRRLAILDLSSDGSQPMVSASGRYVISYNGEVYNFKSVQQDLIARGHAFRGGSDTEVILAAVEEWGSEDLGKVIQQCNGMFAIALWDRKERRLHLIRDRLGIKPLYYGWTGNHFAFASELKAFHAFENFDAEVNRDAVSGLLRYGYIPAPYSIYTSVYKLPPGTSLTLSAADIEKHKLPKPVQYWSAQAAFNAGIEAPLNLSAAEAREGLEALLIDSVKLRMIADVPLGAFLSGGIDSSLVVALMQSQSARPIKTFSIGFSEAQYDESAFARNISKILGTEHTELLVTAKDTYDVIPRLPEFFDEPFADSSQIPTYLVSQLARQQVTVCLSGDGGDELFCGYHRYQRAAKLWQLLNTAPASVRKFVGQLVQPMLPEKLNEALCIENREQLYHRIVSAWANSNQVVDGSHPLRTALNDPAAWLKHSDFYQHMSFVDVATYLPDDILVKVDRASMAVALEARVPLIDYRVVEYVAKLPTAMKIKEGTSKWLLKEVLYKQVPAKHFERAKMGFGLPIDNWLRGPLRSWAESLLEPRLLRQQGYFNAALVQEKWQQHLSRQRDNHYHIWNVLMFQAWLEQNKQQAVSFEKFAPVVQLKAYA